MGTVFLGEHSEGQDGTQVAIKLVRPGMDTEFILGRFRRERQTLARLQHANIARLLDSGATDQGLPYIVMEYVDGLRITEHAPAKLGDRSLHRVIPERLRCGGLCPPKLRNSPGYQARQYSGRP